MELRPLAVTSCFLLMAFAGCTQGPYDPTAEVKETGRTVHLVVSVEDLYEEQIYPGFRANLWAFCVKPFGDDAYSRDAIQYWDPLPGEKSGGTTSWGSKNTAPRPECSVPAPTIEVTQGDRVIVEFSHSHVHPHTIHWHGQYVPSDMDGAPGVSQTAVEKGGSFTYDFIAKRAGTLWYHCHVDTQMHVMQGLYGMFIVKPQDTRFEPKADREAHLIFSSMTRSLVEAIPGVSPHSHPVGQISGTPGFQNPPELLQPDVFLVNGHSFPLTLQQNQTMLHVSEGERLRIRMLNAGTDVETIHLHGHDMLVTHRDGLPLPDPFYVDTLSIGPAERYDVLVVANNPGAWMMHTHVNTHETNDRQAPGGMHTMLVYHGYEDQCAECRVELPGGAPYERPVFMPDDFANTTLLHLNDGAAAVQAFARPASAEWHFPVQLPCAVQSVTVEGSLQGTAVSLAATELDVAVRDRNGTEMGKFHLGRTNQSGTFTSPGFVSTSNGPFYLFPKGNQTVNVTGTALQAQVLLKVKVDYYSSFAEMQRLHHIAPSTYQALCGKYGDGAERVPV